MTDKYLGMKMPDGSPGHVYLCAHCGSEMIGHKHAYMNGIRAGLERAAQVCEPMILRTGKQYAAAIRKLMEQEP